MAAIHVFDRDVLFDLLVRQPMLDKVRQIDEEIEAVVLEEEVELELEEELEGKEELGRGSHVRPPQPEPEEEEIEGELELKEEVELESKGEEEVRGAHVRPPEEEAPSTRTKLEDFDPIQQGVILEAITSTIVLESQEETEEEEKEELEEELREETGGDAYIRPPQPNSETETTVTPPTTEVNSSSRKIQEGHSDGAQLSPFAAWLVKNNSAKKRSVPPLGDENQEERKQALIDRFIEEDPKITPRRAAEFTTHDLAKMSVVEDEEMVTETMAKIYAMQGNQRKAIKAYKLLSLKFPEKSIYFANQIKKLRDSGKSKK
ncbi:hypothetical protein [Sanyastnella coralliicola]|uniref:hypothetical protein n=1 Tax=Sanyastnella coralliicola TaxID=3069118 RepID=UPI0027B9A701|nr:hypothetical protein [Longitalea sp. SCSIO 12813]